MDIGVESRPILWCRWGQGAISAAHLEVWRSIPLPKPAGNTRHQARPAQSQQPPLPLLPQPSKAIKINTDKTTTDKKPLIKPRRVPKASQFAVDGLWITDSAKPCPGCRGAAGAKRGGRQNSGGKKLTRIERKDQGSQEGETIKPSQADRD